MVSTEDVALVGFEVRKSDWNSKHPNLVQFCDAVLQVGAEQLKVRCVSLGIEVLADGLVRVVIETKAEPWLEDGRGSTTSTRFITPTGATTRGPRARWTWTCSSTAAADTIREVCSRQRPWHKCSHRYGGVRSHGKNSRGARNKIDARMAEIEIESEVPHVVCISGGQWLRSNQLAAVYTAQIERVLRERPDAEFVLGDANGAQRFALMYFIVHGLCARATIWLPVEDAPSETALFGGFRVVYVGKSYEERDEQMVQAAHEVILYLPQMGAAGSGVMFEALTLLSKTPDALTPENVCVFVREKSEPWDPDLIDKFREVYEQHHATQAREVWERHRESIDQVINAVCEDRKEDRAGMQDRVRMYVSGAQWPGMNTWSVLYLGKLLAALKKNPGAEVWVGDAKGVDRLTLQFLFEVLAYPHVVIFMIVKDGESLSEYAAKTGYPVRYADDEGVLFRKYPERDLYLARACDVLLVTLPQLGGAASGVMLQALEFYSRTAPLTPKGVFHDMMRPCSENYDSALVAKIARVYEEHYSTRHLI
jgi:hypothetical protein